MRETFEREMKKQAAKRERDAAKRNKTKL